MKQTNMKQKIRVLAIAPYEGLRDSIIREAKAFPEIILDAVTGNLEEGVRLAEENFHSNYDVIISRGGTASLLRERVSLPVKEIPISFIDILQAIQTANDYFHKTAIIGFPNITENARQVLDLLNSDIEIFTISDASDVTAVLELLRKENYQTVICDVISASAARSAGFDTILLTSGSESIRHALRETIQDMQERERLREENIFLREILKAHSGDIAIFREDDSLYFTSLPADTEELLEVLKEQLNEVRSGNTNRILRTLNGYLYTIKTNISNYGDNEYVTFFISRSRAAGINRNSGISFYNYAEAENEYEGSFYQLTGEFNQIRSELKSAINSHKPLLITGEYGTGRTGTAFSYYLNCPDSNHPLVEIDCEMLNERARDFLLNSQRSPLLSTGNVVHFKNLEHNTDSFMKEMLSMLVHVDFCNHNTVIFSCSTDTEVINRHLAYLKDKFQCFQIDLLPLRYRRERIPVMANLYLSAESAAGKISYTRISNDALDLLQEYDWPGNSTQLERILGQLSSSTRDHLIRKEDVHAIMQYESTSVKETGNAPYSLNLRRPLKMIEKDIVEQVLKECGNNQSTAAKRLGISRTTLWRILKEEN